MDAGLVWAIVGAVAGVLAVFVTVLQLRTAPRLEARERQRLNNEVLGGVTLGAGVTIQMLGQASPQPPTISTDHEAPTVQESRDVRAEARDAVYDQLLINDYALGLTQARRAFNVSMAFSIIGGFVLILGVALAIFRADTGGQVAGAVITSAAGVLTSGLSQLFRGQSTKALAHLESQAVELRKDVRMQTNAATAQRLLDEIADTELRSHLQAALILEFTGAKLPDVGMLYRHPSQTHNGDVRTIDGKNQAPEAARQQLS